MCSQETKLRRAESLISPHRLILALRYYLAVLPVGQWVELKRPRRQHRVSLLPHWNLYLWAARRILQLRVKRNSASQICYRLPENYRQNLYVKTGLDLDDPITAMRFRSIPPFFRMSSRRLEAFLSEYPNWFERLRNMLIEHYSVRPHRPSRYEC
jgi:hypothetical protein